MNRIVRAVPEPVAVEPPVDNRGIRILKPGVAAEVRTPSWNGTETVIRPYPSLCHSDPTAFWPYRIDPGGKNYLGYWLRRYEVAWKVGYPKTTFIVHDPAAANRHHYDRRLTPLGVLYTAVDRAFRQRQGKPEWLSLIQGSPAGKPLSMPKSAFLMQGLLLRYQSKPTFAPDLDPPGWGSNRPFILVMSANLGEQFYAALCEERPGYTGDPADFEARYVHGDPVGIEHGRFLRIFEAGTDPRQGAAWSGGDALTGLRSGGGAMNWKPSGRSPDRIGFEFRIEPDFENTRDKIRDQLADTVRAKWLFWEDVIEVMSYEEQAHQLCALFPPDVILYGFRDHPSWITDEVRLAAVQATQAPVLQPTPQHPETSRTASWPPSRPVPEPAALSPAVAGHSPVVDQSVPQGQLPPPPPAATPAAGAAATAQRGTSVMSALERLLSGGGR